MTLSVFWLNSPVLSNGRSILDLASSERPVDLSHAWRRSAMEMTKDFDAASTILCCLANVVASVNGLWFDGLRSWFQYREYLIPQLSLINSHCHLIICDSQHEWRGRVNLSALYVKLSTFPVGGNNGRFVLTSGLIGFYYYRVGCRVFCEKTSVMSMCFVMILHPSWDL